jgi:hypothetical protein
MAQQWDGAAPAHGRLIWRLGRRDLSNSIFFGLGPVTLADTLDPEGLGQVNHRMPAAAMLAKERAG